jgi:hypothetical protein
MIEQDEKECELVLTDGTPIMVETRHYPYLSEWEWEVDPTLDEVVRRREDGRRVLIYEEQVRWQALRYGEHVKYELQRPALRRLFSHGEAFRSLVFAAQAQRFLTEEQFEGGTTPTGLEILGRGLSRVLALYFEWERTVPVDTPVPFATLGDWMEAETGLILPNGAEDTFRRHALKAVYRGWRRLIRELSGRKTDVGEVEATLNEEGLLVLPVLRAALELIATYPIPARP